MMTVRLTMVLGVVVIMAGVFCASAAPEATIVKQASDLFTVVRNIVHTSGQEGGIPIPELKREMQEVSGRTKTLLSVFPRRALELFADLKQLSNSSDFFFATPDSDMISLASSFGEVVISLIATQKKLTEFVPAELTTTHLHTAVRRKRQAEVACCTCCGQQTCGPNTCACTCVSGEEIQQFRSAKR